MKKKTLSEAQVRRFMGLAGIKTLNETAYSSMKKDDLIKSINSLNYM